MKAMQEWDRKRWLAFIRLKTAMSLQRIIHMQAKKILIYSFFAQESDYTVDNKSIDTGDIPASGLKSPEQIITEEEARDILKQNIRTAKQLNKEDYTSDSWAAFETVLTEATEVAAAYTSTADDINDVNDKLVDAMTALEPVVSSEADIMDNMIVGD